MKEVLLMDIDGVLTDGMVYIDSMGNETKRLSFDDIDAIFELKKKRIKIGFITGEEGGFSEYVRRRFSPDYFASGCKNKLEYFVEMEKRENLDRSRVCFVGDSVKDVELLGYLDLTFAPSDADIEARRAAKRVLSATRGKGAVREVARFILGGDDANLNSGKPGTSVTRNIRGVAIIPACEGAMGIPHKNTKLLVGKPLISYAIEACLETPGIEKVVVCTESGEIMEAARRCGDVVEVIELPESRVDNDSTPEKVLLHAIQSLEGRGYKFDTVLFVQGTSPLLEPSDLAGLIERMREGCDSASFYTEDFGVFFDEAEPFRPRLPRGLRVARKREAGNAWAFLKDGFLASKERTFGRIGLCRLDPPKHLDIDTECDFHLAERMLQLRERKKRHLYWRTGRAHCEEPPDFEAAYWGEVVDPDGNRRNRMLERQQRIADAREELEYINSLRLGRMLDIGCGMGDLLSAVAVGWEKHGLEVSEFAAREATKYGNIFVGPLMDAPYTNEYFDLVVMNHVIEHLEAPDEEIARVRTILKHRGKLVIGTPDFDGAMARRYGQKYRLLHDRTHISLFSRVSLRQFLEDHGFEVERESFPFFETRHFTADNLLKLLDPDGVSPPFWGSFMTFYCVKK